MTAPGPEDAPPAAPVAVDPPRAEADDPFEGSLTTPAVRAELARVRSELGAMRPAQLHDGSWFHIVLQRTARRFLARQKRRCVLEPMREAYPELDDARLADRIVTRASRRAAFVGGTSGALISAAEIAAFTTLGSSISGAFLLLLAELAIIERLQVGMVFTLSELHGYQMAHDDLRDVGALYGNVLKVKGATRVAAWARDGSVALFRIIGVRYLQRAFVKYSVPVLSVGLGAGMNYVLTRSLGKHARKAFERQGDTDAQLARLHAQEDALRRLLLALMGLMAAVDGQIDKRERALLRRTLDRLAVDGTPRSELLDALERPEETIFGSLEAIEDDEFHALVLELVALMAVADGRLDQAELDLLERLSDVCGFEFEPGDLRQRYQGFLIDTRRRLWRRRKPTGASAMAPPPELG